MKRIKVNILNSEYVLKTDADEEYVHEIAKYIEQKVKEITKGDSSIVAPQPFLLATLKITDEYFRLNREFEEYKNRAEQRSQELVELLDKSLPETGNNDGKSWYQEGFRQE